MAAGLALCICPELRTKGQRHPRADFRRGHAPKPACLFARGRRALLGNSHETPARRSPTCATNCDRAAVIDPAAFPADVVTMNSTVEFEDLSTGEIEEYTITFPENAAVEQKRILILAPIGTAPRLPRREHREMVDAGWRPATQTPPRHGTLC